MYSLVTCVHAESTNTPSTYYLSRVRPIPLRDLPLHYPALVSYAIPSFLSSVMNHCVWCSRAIVQTQDVGYSDNTIICRFYVFTCDMCSRRVYKHPQHILPLPCETHPAQRPSITLVRMINRWFEELAECAAKKRQCVSPTAQVRGLRYQSNNRGGASLGFGGEPDGYSKITCQKRQGTSSARSIAPGEERWYVKYDRPRTGRERCKEAPMSKETPVGGPSRKSISLGTWTLVGVLGSVAHK